MVNFFRPRSKGGERPISAIRVALFLTILNALLKVLSYSQCSHSERIDWNSEPLTQFLPAIYLRALLSAVVLENQFAVLRGQTLQAGTQTIDTPFRLIRLIGCDLRVCQFAERLLLQDAFPVDLE